MCVPLVYQDDSQEEDNDRKLHPCEYCDAVGIMCDTCENPRRGK